MENWLTYRAADFLLFSERVYWRLFERLNEAIWLWPLAATALMLAALALIYPRHQQSQRVLLIVLAISWAAGGLLFVWQIYAQVHLGMPYLAPFFAVQAVLLTCAATVKTRGRYSRAAMFLVFGACLWPLLAPVFGRPITQAELFGTAPDPTAVATLGLALLMRSAGWRVVLMIVPTVWLIQSALTLWILSGAEALPPAIALAFAFGAAVWPRSNTRPAH